MKSVLLGGLKEYLVNDSGKPLSAPGGRAKFFLAGTSTPETVYSDIELTEDNALGPVVYTNELGYLPAVWLKTDRLYKVVVEQKIASSTTSRWAVLWEVDNVGYIDPHENETPGDYPLAVSSISALKAVDHTAHDKAMVLGYFSPGDWGEPSIFLWDSSCTKSSDDGAYVRPNDVEEQEDGRWVQVFDGAVLDVRKFGALPDMAENSDVTAKVVNAVQYSQDNSSRTRPLTVAFVAPGHYDFVGDFDFSQYHFTDISDNSNTQYPIEWFIGNDVVFRNISEIASTYTLSANTEILADKELVNGLVTLEVEGGGKIQVDPAWWGTRNCVLEDCYVRCRSVTTNFKNFTHCDVESNGMMGGEVSLTDMGFKETWLVEDFDLGNLDLTNVKYGVRDCNSGDSYIAIKNSQNDPNYGDCGGAYLTDAPMLAGHVKLSNAIGSIAVSDTGLTDLTLENFNGTVTTPATASQTPPNLNAERCDITFSGGSYFQSFTLSHGSSRGAAVSASGGTLLEHSSTFNDFHVEGNFKAINCSINRSISHVQGGVIKVSIVGCRMAASYSMAGSSSGTIVHGVFSNNVGTSSNPILIDRTNIDTVDSHHSYTYSNNSGTFINDEYKSEEFDATVEFFNSIGPLPVSGSYRTLQRDINSGGVYLFNWNNNFDTASFFRIGTDKFPVLATPVLYSPDSLDNNAAFSASAYACAYFIDGFNWGIRTLWDDDSVQDATQLRCSRNFRLFGGCDTFDPNSPLPSSYTQRLIMVYENMDKHL